ELRKEDQRLADNLTFIQRQGTLLKADAFLPAIAEYSLIMYADNPDRPGQFIFVHRQRIRNSTPCPVGACFPTIYDNFALYNGSLEAPIEGVLHAGPHSFKMHLDQANAVFVAQGFKETNLHHENDLWQGNAVLVA